MIALIPLFDRSLLAIESSSSLWSFSKEVAKVIAPFEFSLMEFKKMDLIGNDPSVKAPLTKNKI